MERISARQLILMGAMIVSSITIVIIPNQLTVLARQQAYWSYIVCMLIMFFPLWMLSRVSKRFPGKDLFQVCVERRPLIGRILAGIVVFFFFVAGVRDMRLMTEFVSIGLLPATPLWSISVLILLAIGFSARMGLEVLARMTEFFFPIFLIIAVLIIFMIGKDVSFSNLQPLNEFGFSQLGQATWILLGSIGEVVAVCFVFPNQTLRFRDGVVSVVLGTAVVTWLFIITLGVLNVPLMERFMFPTYEMVRQIRVTDFLDRMDLFLVSLWLPSAILRIAVSLYVVCHGLGRMMPIQPEPGARILAIPLAIFMFVCNFWIFQNSYSLIRFNGSWGVMAVTAEILVPLFMFLLLRPTNGSSSLVRG